MNVDDIFAKCDHLSAMGLWPHEQDLPYRGWLNNFNEEQRMAAARLLNRFIFISESMAQDALSTAYQRLLRTYTSPGTNDEPVPTEKLAALHNSIIVAPIRGESPSATDSGFAYMRVARDQLHFEESQIKSDPIEAAQEASKTGQLVVLIDDVSGSGDQIRSTLRRRTKRVPSLNDICSRRGSVACLTAVMTSCANTMLTTKFPQLGIFAGHILDLDTYGLRAIFPEDCNPEIYDLLDWASQRLQIPKHADRRYGYLKLGLLLCFHNSIPDFSLPVLWATDAHGWTPLKERRSA